jgi:two-component system, LuxR family, sensor kinase FixL
MSRNRSQLAFAPNRIHELIEKLEGLAAGESQTCLPISPNHDELDAIAFGINVLADELRWAHARVTESERAKTDELREGLAHLGRVAMLDVLAGSLAHEINQPLTAVTVNTEAALNFISARPVPLSDLRETLTDILNDSRRASDVVQRMRTLLKKGSTEHAAIDLNGAVSEVVQLVQSNAAGRRIALDVELSAGIDPVWADRFQVQQVVLNLLMNAFDAVQGRKPALRRVSLRTSARDRSGAVDVSDHGAGLSDEALSVIFDPFYTTKRDGLGLGLWICRGIVAAHGGSLRAARNPGTGMTFSACFPFSPPTDVDQPGWKATTRLQEPQ